MRFRTSTFAITIALLLTVTAGAQRPRAKKEAPFNPVGSYSPEGEQNWPGGDVIGNLVITKRGTTYGGYLSVANIKKRQPSNVDYKFAELTAKPQQLSFTTIPIRGVTWSFEGRFLKWGSFSKMAQDSGIVEGVAEGTLTKMSGSRKTEQPVKLSYILGG